MKGIDNGTPKNKTERIALGYEKATPEEQERALNTFLRSLYIQEQDYKYHVEMPTGGYSKRIGGRK